MNKKNNLLTILGPTASGKTTLASNVAYRIDGEIISADSRQVYKSMNIGTGKDYDDYLIKSTKIPYHLIDIAEAGYKYNVFEYQNDFLKVFQNILNRNKFPILCGGTGMYIEAVTKGFKLISVPVNINIRNDLENLSINELTKILQSFKKLHNTSDITSKKRLIRAIEIEKYYIENEITDSDYPDINNIFIGINPDVSERRTRITKRLKERLNQGMISEVEKLLNSGITKEDLIYYGLEYKFITQYIIGEINYDKMFKQLEIAIHQFAKRQMTWFRGMERRGVKIIWIDFNLTLEEKVDEIIKILRKNNFIKT